MTDVLSNKLHNL